MIMNMYIDSSVYLADAIGCNNMLMAKVFLFKFKVFATFYSIRGLGYTCRAAYC